MKNYRTVIGPGGDLLKRRISFYGCYDGVDMAGMIKSEYRVLDDLRRDGWNLYDMAEYEPNIFKIADWCREQFGPMLINPELDWGCEWHGTTLELPPERRYFTIFAFKNPAHYTLLKLRWAGV